MTVFCDNYGCLYIDECGFCDCDSLSIVGGVCEGSYHSNRNARAERTCTIEYRRGEYVCTACGNAVGDDDPWSENFVNGNAVEMWAYCPNCGAKVVER